jgi:carbamoyltransferase
MGLSAYGNRSDLYDLTKVVRTSRDDYEINPEVFSVRELWSMQEPVFNDAFLARLGLPRRYPGQPVEPKHKRLAISIQEAFERSTVALATRIRDKTGLKQLVVAGGCAQNCVGLAKVRKGSVFDEIVVPAAAGDAGTALGAAYLATVQHAGMVGEPVKEAGIGPCYNDEEIERWMKLLQIRGDRIDDVPAAAAADLAKGQLLAWFQGGTEFGARALGHRSILADPTDPDMRDAINSRVKFRESFRPFAPSVCEQNAANFFADAAPSPFMTHLFDVLEPKRIPAVTHVDGTARVQTVNMERGDRLYYRLLQECGEQLGVPMVLNTSFNINGQPIVNDPQQAIYTFYASGLDTMYLGAYRITKS